MRLITFAFTRCGVGNAVAAQRRAEVQLRAIEFERPVVGPLVRLDFAGRRRHKATPASVDQMDALPAAVGDTTEIKLAGCDEDLFNFAVELVAVDVEVFDAQSSDLALVDEEAGFHFGRAEQAHVGQRIDVSLDFGSSERAELHFTDVDVGQAECFAGRIDIASDERRFTGFLVRIHNERLDNGRIDHTANDGDDQPERRGEQRQTPRVGLDHRQVQASGQDGDQDQQHDRRNLRINNRVGGTVDDAPSAVGQLVTIQPVVASLQHGQDGKKYRHVCLCCVADHRGR